MAKSQDEQDIRKVIAAESAAYYRGDYEGLARHWLQTPQARRVFAGTNSGTRTHNGWEQISNSFKAAIDRMKKSFELDEFCERKNFQICVSHDMAWVHYDQLLKRSDPDFAGFPLQHEIKILHRVAGAWKIACMAIIAPKQSDGKTAEIYLTYDGTVSGMNWQATVGIDAHPGLKISGGRLSACSRKYDPGLQKEIAHRLALLKTVLPPGFMNRDVHAIPLGEDDYSRPNYCWVHAEQDAVIVSFDDAQVLGARLDIAAETFGLSPSQRKIAGQLVTGNNLTMTAEELVIKPSTVRTQLRRMFEKTGTRSQTALISTLLCVAPPD